MYNLTFESLCCTEQLFETGADCLVYCQIEYSYVDGHIGPLHISAKRIRNDANQNMIQKT